MSLLFTTTIKLLLVLFDIDIKQRIIITCSTVFRSSFMSVIHQPSIVSSANPKAGILNI